MALARRLAVAGGLGLGFFALVLLAGPIWQPGFDPMTRYGSELAVGPNGWLMTIAFLAAGAGIAAIALGLRMTVLPSTRLLVGTVLLGLVGLGLLASAAVPVGSHRPGVHEFIGLGSFVALLISLLSLASAFAKDPAWMRLASPTRWVAALSFVVLLVMLTQASPGGDSPALPLDPYAGFLQKLFLAPWFSLLGVVAYRLANVPSPDPSEAWVESVVRPPARGS